jgi:two-component system sensor histidine kinase HydH
MPEMKKAQNLTKDVGAFTPINKKPVGIQTSPWVIMSTAIILLLVVVVLAIQNINREKRYMSEILIEKGAALIRAFEAGARTGMMGMMWGEDQVQKLLEETARQPDILYIMIIDGTGKILAHNDRHKINGYSAAKYEMPNNKSENKERWRILNTGNRQSAFEVYRYFQPIAERDLSEPNRFSSDWCRPGMMRGKRGDWCFPSTNPADSPKVIFVGLDMAYFEEARAEDIRNTVIISSILLLMGFGGFLSVIYAQSYRATRRSLQDTSAFANEMVSSLPVGLIATDNLGKIVYFNTAAENITGIQFDFARGKKADEIFPENWCNLEEYLDKGNIILEEEMECAFTDKKVVPVSVSATRIINESGRFVGNIVILRDIGEIRQLQEEIRRKEKLAALGGLAAGVAHEIRNPLSSIKGMASYFESKFVKGSDDREAAGVLIKEVERLNRVISELLNFASPSELKKKRTDINDVIEHSVRLVQSDAQSKNIQIKWSRSENLPHLLIDEDRLSQCLLNLYVNAMQAMETGGVLTIKSLLDANKSVKVEVADTGKGIGTDDLQKIFNPYFTTKSSGTGLGLAIVHKIIEAHGGRITIRSTPDKGTIFTLILPIHSNHIT